MLEMLKARKEALQERGVKGFTLMEMLIVIAIIAVLVAIAIPVLGAQLENAQEATDAANIRSSYAEVAASALQNPKQPVSAEVDMTQNDKTQWSNESLKDSEIGGIKVNTITITDGKVVIAYDGTDIKIAGQTAKTSTLKSSASAGSGD